MQADADKAVDEGASPMDVSLARVCALLRSEDSELRTAAARILGAVAPSDTVVIHALGQALESQDRHLQTAALDSIEALGGADAYDQVAPLLDDKGDLGRRAMEVVAGMGRPVLRSLKRRFGAAGEAGRRRILAIAARLRGPVGLDLIVRALETGHGDEVRAAGRRLAEELADAAPKERASLVNRLEKFLASAKAQADTDAASAAFDLLGRVAGRESARMLLARAKENGDAAAIKALARLARRTPLEEDELGELLASLNEPAFASMAAPALEQLERAPFSSAHAPALIAHLEGRDPALRRFATTALGHIDTPKSAAALLTVIQGNNPVLSERAREALRGHQSALTPVAHALARATDSDRAWILARMLEPHAFKLKPDEVQLLANATAALLEPGDPRAVALLSVLKDRHAEALLSACLRHVKRLKRNRDASGIANLIRPLVREEIQLTPQADYELALSEIVRGKKDVVRQVRLRNVGLLALEPLLQDTEFGLGTRLKRDKHFLGAEEYYLIGCHFAERAGSDRIFGGDILRWMVKVFPRENISQAASHKLVMEGFPPPPRERPRVRRPAPAKKPVASKVPATKTKPAPTKETIKKAKTATKKAGAVTRTKAAKRTAKETTKKTVKKRTARKR